MWTFNPAATGMLAAAALAYLGAVWRLRRAGTRWPAARTFAFLVPGLGSIAVCTMSGLAIYARVLLWPLAVQITTLVSLCPVLVAFGDPLGLLRESLPAAGRARYDSAATGRLARVLTFPVLPGVLAVVLELGVLFSGFAGSAARDSASRDLIYLLTFGVGSLFAVPMLRIELLPSWCTPPVRLLLAGVDGVLDAIPGIAVVGGAGTIAGGYYAGLHLPWPTGTFTDRQIAGGLMITLAEVVAIPMAAALAVAWVRDDERQARAIDASLEAADIVRRAEVTLPAGTGADRSQPDGSDRPWWEIDPGPLRDRAARYGWPSEGGPDRRTGR